MLRKKKIKSQNNSKVAYKIVVAIWLLLFLFVGIAYSSLASSVRMEGTLTFQSHIYDYVYITNVRINDSSGAASVNYSFMDHELNATIQATTCNSYVTYELDIVNRSPYLAYITNTSIASQINGSGNTTNTLSVDFLDVTPNVTTIPAHSTKTITVKIYNNCSGSDDQVNVKADFEYSLYKYFDLTVNASESDATVSITTQEGTFTGTGSLTHRVYEGETATFSASKKYFYTANGTYTMTAADHTENLTLQADPHRDLTIETNASTATIIVKKGNEILCNGTGNLVCSILIGDEIYFSVDDPEYYYTYINDTYSGYSETFTMPAQDTTKNVTLTERPWITGQVKNDDNTVAKTQSDINWHAGYYLVEVWGGYGGRGTFSTEDWAAGGRPGYVYGVIYIPYNTTVYRTAGGRGGSSTSNPAGGANGGGRGGSSSSGTSKVRGGGGGYSAFAIGTTEITNSTINSGYVKFIAGGGGGRSSAGGTFNTEEGQGGGPGGTILSTDTNMKHTISTGTVFDGSNGASASTTFGGGGTYNAGGSAGSNSASAGSLLAGGNGYERGGGGGAGYYGGGGGSIRNIFASNPGGGGGGSSFIANDVVFTNLSSDITANLSGNGDSGTIKITWIGKTM